MLQFVKEEHVSNNSTHLKFGPSDHLDNFERISHVVRKLGERWCTVKTISMFTSIYRFIVLNLSLNRCKLPINRFFLLSFYRFIVLSFYRFFAKKLRVYSIVLSFYRFIVVKKMQSFSIVLSFYRCRPIVLSL